MQLHEYWNEVRRIRASSSQRYGQVAFNVLSDVRKDLSVKIVDLDFSGVKADPFYLEKASGPVWENFVAFITENW